MTKYEGISKECQDYIDQVDKDYAKDPYAADFKYFNICLELLKEGDDEE
jgi:hypothetical protein